MKRTKHAKVLRKQSRQAGFAKIKQETRPQQDIETEAPFKALFSTEHLKDAVARAANHLLSLQHPKGYWAFPLEADATIPSEYVLLQRFLNRRMTEECAAGLARYLRCTQLADGGWALYEGGAADVSASVKAYFALKLMGDRPGASHMAKARRLIWRLGGASRVNVFTRITLALFGQIPWRTLPAMPPEIMLLPRWFFFHLDKVSYWSRTVIVPLLILLHERPVSPLQQEEGIEELFLEPAHTLVHLHHFAPNNIRKNLFIHLDRILKRTDRFVPRFVRRKALRHAELWTLERMQGEGGIGGIFPAMANSLMALKVLGYPEAHADFQRGLKAVDDLLLGKEGEEGLCQPCVSPVWDSCLSLIALLEAGIPPEHKAVRKGVEWLFEKQVLVRGDWSRKAPDLEPGGWAFQFENGFYPDVDDTPAVLMAVLRAGALENGKYWDRIERAVHWIAGMQSSDGGWGSFDVDNTSIFLNDIPFADHGALVDPSTSDVTGRCIELFSMLGFGRHIPCVAKGLDFLRREQESWGAWFGRWGVNYLYGTWSVLAALRQAGEDMTQPYVRKAVAWLKSCQNPDNGWGETCLSYSDPALAGKGPSTPSQTSWALLGLIAAGEVQSLCVQRGIHYLLSTQNEQGGWDERYYTGTGFPRVFFLRYHGYRQFFPLWALGVYRRLRMGKRTRQDEVAVQRRSGSIRSSQGRR
jgi:squalene-hopene/tetraprenyl-beta-curcumene cyclase